MERTPRIVAVFVLVASSLIACGDDDTGKVDRIAATNNGATNNGATNNETNNGAATNNDEPPVPPPVQVAVHVDPARATYATGARVLPVAVVRDASGQVVQDAVVSWSTSPAGAAMLLDTGRFELLEEGAVELEGCVDGPDGPVCGHATLVVDVGGPRIELDSPQPGAELTAEEAPRIPVAGRVIDTHGELYVFVNGVPVEVAEDGGFATEVEPRFGVNHIEVSATDGLQPLETVAGADVLWAPTFHRAGDGSVLAAASFDEGISLRLGQRFFDDGIPLTQNGGVVRTEDLADIFELLLERIDYLGQIPNPIADSATFRLQVSSFDVGQPAVAFVLTDEGAELFIRIDGVIAGTSGFLQVENQRLSLDGQVRVGMSGFVQLRMRKAGLGEPYDVRVLSVNLALEDASSRFASPEANAIFELAASPLRTTLEALLTDTIRDQFVEQLPGLLLTTLTSVEGAISGQTLPIDTGLGRPLVLTIDAAISTVEPIYRNGLTARLWTTTRLDQLPTHPTSRGVALLAPADSLAPFLRNSRLQLGVRMGMLNGMLHALWNAGMLDLDIGSQLPPEFAFLIQSGAVSGQLPPILTPARPEDGYDLRLTVGQLDFTAVLPDRTDVYGITISTGVDVDFQSNTLIVTIHDDPEITTWSISSTAEATYFDGPSVRDIILSQLWPRIAEVLAQNLSLRLPDINLSQLGVIAPDLSALTLQIRLTREIQVRQDFLMFEGNLEGRLE